MGFSPCTPPARSVCCDLIRHIIVTPDALTRGEQAVAEVRAVRPRPPLHARTQPLPQVPATREGTRRKYNTPPPNKEEKKTDRQTDRQKREFKTEQSVTAEDKGCKLRVHTAKRSRKRAFLAPDEYARWVAGEIVQDAAARVHFWPGACPPAPKSVLTRRPLGTQAKAAGGLPSSLGSASFTAPISTTAGAELNLLSTLLGMDSRKEEAEEGFKLSIFDETRTETVGSVCVPARCSLLAARCCPWA
eukprot:1278465-Rhodomonas_salina.1